MITKETINVTLVEDDYEDADLLARALEWSGIDFQLTHMERLDDALDFLENNLADVVVLDLGLPDGEGLESLEAIQSSHPKVPVVILTGNEDEANAANAVEHGAQDYLAKGSLDGRQIARSLTYAIQRKKAELQLQGNISDLQVKADTDQLTGVMNRRSMLHNLTNTWEASVKTGVPFSCVMLDLDFFKRVNDTYGHLIGDDALVAVAQALKDASRPTDIVCRYGGEEFCILLPETTEEQAAHWADRARIAVSNVSLPTSKGNLTVTISLGVAAGRMGRGATEMIDRADQALLVSKQRGKNRVSCYSKLNDEAALDEVCLEKLSGDNAPARYFMTTPIKCLLATDSLSTAVDQLLTLGTNSMPVVDESGELVGIISEKDLLEWSPGSNSWETPLSEVMNTTVVAFQEDDRLEKIRRFFTRVSVRRVVITNGKRPVGVLSRSNILRHFHNLANPEHCNKTR